MIGTVRARGISLRTRQTLFVGAACVAFAGCDGAATTRNAVESGGGSSRGGTGTASGGSATAGGVGGANCPAGAETCACYGNHTCNDGLVCASNLCVALGVGGTTSSGGASSAGGAIGGSPGSGGVVSAGGVAPSNGGVAIGGSGQSEGGTNVIGGSTSIGGATALGGSTSIGGATALGSSTSIGGATALGSSTSIGGTTALGGSTSIGGTTNGVAGGGTGGNPGSGGGSLGGSSSNSGGASNAGQSSSGGSTAMLNCGNGIVEGSETCDTLPKNNDLGDGCTPTCMAEPSCPPAGGPCTSKCGDGLVFGDEACDDGNAVGGDGCSATCTVEAGFQCSQPPLGDTMLVPMVVRDFNTGGDFEKGSSFNLGLNFANQGLLQPTLDANGLKPLLASTTGTYNGVAGQASGIASPASFAQWYDDAAPPSGNLYHGTLATTLTLYRKPDGSAYVNRYGASGEQYSRMSFPAYCGTVGKEDHDAAGNPIPCTSCLYDTDPSTPQCDPAPDTTVCQTKPDVAQCVKNATGSQWSGIWVDAAYDGSPVWFPADGLTPFSPSSTATIPGYYDPAWPIESGSPMHNFSFTTEVRFWFKYDASQTYTLSISGDDDIWVFVNKRLAVDMGGIHTPVDANLTLASGTGTATVKVSPTNIMPAPAPITTHPDLGGLQDGNVYEIVVFQAERQTKSSSYQIGLVGFNTAHSVCVQE
jgi:fibro-slime domain-containing protein